MIVFVSMLVGRLTQPERFTKADYKKDSNTGFIELALEIIAIVGCCLL